MKNYIKRISLCLGLASLSFAQTTTTAPIYNASILAGVATLHGIGDGLPSLSAPLYEPQGIAADANGNVFISEFSGNRIRRIDAVTGLISTIADQTTFVTRFPNTGTPSAGTPTAANGNFGIEQALNGPVGLAFDTLGNLYVANQGSHAIIRLSFGTGGTVTATAVMPNTNGRYCGDANPGMAYYACLQNPQGIALDGNNNLYIADSDNGRIRMIPNSNGCLYASPIQTCTIYTIAGNQGQFTPTFAPLTNLGAASTVAKITNTFTGTNTVGDGGLAVLAKVSNGSQNAPFGIVAAPDGSAVYFSDPGINRVRKINMSTGIITTVLGACTASTSATNNAGSSNRPAIVPCPSGTFASATGGSGATFTLYDGNPGSSATANAPRGLALDSVNNLLYVADTGNNRIRVINLSTGIVTTALGSGTAGDSGDSSFPLTMNINQPYGLALKNGNLYFTENTAGIQGVSTGANRVRVTNFSNQPTAGIPNTNSLGLLQTQTLAGVPLISGGTLQATSAYLYAPNRTAVDANGNVYISETGTNKIKQITTDGNIHDFAGTGAAGAPPKSPINGTYQDAGPAISARLNNPGCMTFDGNGNMYFADTANSIIRKIDTNGNISTVVGRAKVTSCNATQTAAGCVLDLPDYYSPGVSQPSNANGGFYLGDGGQASAALLNYPQCVASDAAGDLYIADTGNNAIRYVNASTGVITTIAGGQSTAGDSAAQAVGAPGAGGPVDGRSGTAEGVGQSSATTIVGQSSAVSTITTNANYYLDGNALWAGFSSPRGIAVDKNGNVYVTDFDNCVVRELTPSAGGGYNIYSIIGNLSSCNDDGAAIPTGTGIPTVPITARIRPSTSVAVDGSGKVYVAMTGTVGNEGRILLINAAHTAYFDIAGVQNPNTLTTAGNYTGATSQNHFGVGVDVGLTYFPGTNDMELQVPGALGVAVDASQNVYVTDRDNLVKKLSCTKNCLP